MHLLKKYLCKNMKSSLPKVSYISVYIRLYTIYIYISTQVYPYKLFSNKLMILPTE